MTRTHSRNPEPHRDLFISGDPQRGEDVGALIRAADRRLDARNVDRDWTGDGRHGVLAHRQDFDGLVTAARLLGVLESTLDERDGKGRAVLTVGAQRLIRHPGTRTPEQLARAEDRFAALIKSREARERPPAGGGGVSGLPAAKRSEARDRAVAAMRLLLHNAPAVHYTQGPRRFEGIAHDMRSAQGQFPRFADCSSSTTWALWNALTAVGGGAFPDIVNGSGWRAGFTGTQLAHGDPVDDLIPADLVFYGVRGTTGKHVAMYVGDGMVISHGSEAAPFFVPVGYRADRMGNRRYI